MAEDKNLDEELEQKNDIDSISIDDTEQAADNTLSESEIGQAVLNEAKDEASQISNESNDDESTSQEMITVRPVKFQQFEMEEPNRSIKRNLDIMQDVSMHISVELGKTKSTIKEVMDYKEGSIVELNKIAGEQVEVYANNKLVARGEVIVIEDKFGVRVTSTNLPKTIQ